MTFPPQVATVQGQKISQTDIVVSNGVIHLVDGVIMPTAKTIKVRPGAVSLCLYLL